MYQHVNVFFYIIGVSLYESGGAGTIYKEKRNMTSGVTEHRDLTVDNQGHAYPHGADYLGGDLRSLLDGDYADIHRVGGVTWLYHDSLSYTFDVMTISGNAHVAVLSNTSSEDVDVSIGVLNGDRSGILHTGQRQTFRYRKIDVYLPINIMAYRYVASKVQLFL